MFNLLRKARRRRVLEKHAISDHVWRQVVRDAPVLGRLDEASQTKLREYALLFMHEKAFEPVQDMRLTEPMKLKISALACLPVLEIGLDLYDHFISVIVYPGEFVVRNREHTDEAGVVHTADDVLSGEAWDRGPVVLAWSDVEQSGRGDGYNVVVHEFAHKLDGLDGATNGVPPLHRSMRVQEWTAAFQAAYDDLNARLDRGEQTWLDPYAAENPAEFFAVCAEMFFELPEDFADEYPALYRQMAAYFRQDPARLDAA